MSNVLCKLSFLSNKLSKENFKCSRPSPLNDTSLYCFVSTAITNSKSMTGTDCTKCATQTAYMSQSTQFFQKKASDVLWMEISTMRLGCWLFLAACRHFQIKQYCTVMCNTHTVSLHILCRPCMTSAILNLCYSYTVFIVAFSIILVNNWSLKTYETLMWCSILLPQLVVQPHTFVPVLKYILRILCSWFLNTF